VSGLIKSSNSQPLIRPNNNINANIFLTNLPDCSQQISISELNNQIKADRNKCNLNLPHWPLSTDGLHGMVGIPIYIWLGSNIT